MPVYSRITHARWSPSRVCSAGSENNSLILIVAGMQMLREQPSFAPKFDAVYGEGSAVRYLREEVHWGIGRKGLHKNALMSSCTV